MWRTQRYELKAKNKCKDQLWIRKKVSPKMWYPAGPGRSFFCANTHRLLVLWLWALLTLGILWMSDEKKQTMMQISPFQMGLSFVGGPKDQKYFEWGVSWRILKIPDHVRICIERRVKGGWKLSKLRHFQYLGSGCIENTWTHGPYLQKLTM